MFIPPVDILSSFSARSPIIAHPFLDQPSQFSLDNSGILSLIGGDDAVSAIAAVHIYGNRHFLGWYNNPGSFQIAKRFRSFARLTSGIVSSKPHGQTILVDPTKLFESDARKGPKFRAAHSGTVIQETSYLASLLMKECAVWDSEGKVVPGRRTQPVGITIVDLGQAPASEMRPTHASVSTLLLSSVPIVASVGACVLCALSRDLYASTLILVGIIASGLSCLVLGSADFVFTHPEPAKGSPAGDGILMSDKDIVLLKGTEGAVNAITRGSFSLRFSSERHYRLIRWCSHLFFVQCVVQLLLIPNASLFGQIMFLASLGVSASYNAWLSSLDKEKIHRKLLFDGVLENPTFARYTLGTRTTAVVFMLLVLRLQDPTTLLDELLPNDTKVWKQWKATLLNQLRRPRDKPFLDGNHMDAPKGFTEQEKALLELLYEDARAAYEGYEDHLCTYAS